MRFLSASDAGDLCYTWNGQLYVLPAGAEEGGRIDVMTAADTRHNDVEYVDVSRDITQWMENVMRLARRLDAYMADDVIRQDLQSVEPAIESLKQRLALEDSDQVKRQISQAIAQKQIHRDNLRKLQNAMEQAQFQLESTITAIGTVYSQVKLLSARDVASGRAQRLQQEIVDQVQALQDVVETVDEMAQASADPMGLGLSATDLAALDASSGSKTKGASGT